MRSLWRRLLRELGLAWCDAVHLEPRRYFVHDKLGVVSLCLTCRRLHV